MQKTILLVCVALLSLGLASCGKRGALLPPPGYETPEK
jgi:predicted small lipoprotein YifL